MNAPLPPAVAELLARICGMMGSDHDGERAAAALQASRLLQRHGLTWRDVLLPPAATYSPPQPPHVAAAERVLRQANHLNDWEVGFLRGIMAQPSLSPKQAVRLDHIICKLRRGGP
jgi:hypothetical protein